MILFRILGSQEFHPKGKGGKYKYQQKKLRLERLFSCVWNGLKSKKHY
jgi:hypothetical protein